MRWVLGAAMQERRTSSRKKSFLKGTLYFDNRLSSAECLVRDLSEQGARVQFSSPVRLPDMVELYIPVRDQTFEAKVRWRRDDEVGLAFAANALGGAAPEGDLEQRVKTLEQEVARLQRQVAEIRREYKRVRGED